jgi:lysophospholipase L1-like esterase
LGRVRRRWWAVAALALVALAVLFGTGNSLGRQALFYALHMECFKLPHEGRVAAIGDSITAGTSKPDWGMLGDKSWFSHAVCDHGVPYGYNAGIPNHTTEMVAARLQQLVDDHHPRVVAILTGTNDVLHRLSLAHAVTVLDGMVRQLRADRVVPVLATVPPFNANPQGARDLNRRIKALAGRERAPLIDFYPVLVGPDGRYRPGLTVDGLHPNPAGSEAMARVAAPVLERARRSAGRPGP